MTAFIAIPLKKPSDVDIVKPLTNFIKSNYNSGTNLKDHSEAITEFSKLRNNALWRAFEKYESSLEFIYSYYDQVCALEGKIPLHELQIPFKWRDAFDKTIFGGKLSLTISTLTYEKLCVLFNIAALQSSVASTQSLDSDESLKLAAKLFQQSAGIFNYLKGNVMLAIQQEPTPDMSPDTLSALCALMLAQGQEIFVHKAIHDSMKEPVIAKLASQAEDLYADALKLFQKEIFRSFWDKEWIPLIIAKQSGYRAMAELYQSYVCKDNKWIGQEISRLEYAIDLFKAAQSRSNKSGLFEEYANRAQRRLMEVKKDNDFIYHERIPDIKSLEIIGKANIVKLLPINHPMSRSFKDLFDDLLPVCVHQALSAYELRRTELVNTEISKLREMTHLLNTAMANLNLPAAIEDTSGTEIPLSLLEKAAFVRMAGGVQALESSMNELPELLQRNRDILDETEKMLREERESDDQLREQFKERWTRTPSLKLTEQLQSNAQKYRSIIDNAIAADKIVRKKFEEHQEGMELLSKNENQLSSTIPSGSGVNESCSVSQLRALMEDVETLKAERDVIESELKSTSFDMKPLFLSALATNGTIDEPNLSVVNIGKIYGPLTSQVRDSLVRQESLIAEIQSSHAVFTKEQCGSGSSREMMLRRLASAHDAFKELKNNLQEGAKFYNDLTQVLVVFQNKIYDFCFARKTEKEELMKDLTSSLSHTGPASTPAIPSHYSVDSSLNIQSNSGVPQLPYPTQYTGAMPVPYGASPVAPYPTYAPPPLPNVYNPYATISYSQGGYAPGTYPASQTSQQGYQCDHYATVPRYPGHCP